MTTFAWDEAKRRSNIAKHGIDFIDVQALFAGAPSYTQRSTYPEEERFLTVGMLDGRVITVVWTERDGTIRVISARRSRRAEERAYRQLFQ